MSSIRLSGVTVEKIFRDCLFRDDEPNTGYAIVDGITFRAVFHPVRLDEHREEIVDLLDLLPPQFKQTMGDSFLNACMDKNGRQWTGEHRIVELLLLLGQAVGKVKVLTPRREWKSKPGGLPFIAVT